VRLFPLPRSKSIGGQPQVGREGARLSNLQFFNLWMPGVDQVIVFGGYDDARDSENRGSL
jgi:hypothetical protein